MMCVNCLSYYLRGDWMKSKKYVFYISLAISLGLIAIGVFMPSQLESFSNSSLDFIYNNLGWFILGSVFTFFVFCMYIGLSKFGHIRLGKIAIALSIKQQLGLVCYLVLPLESVWYFGAWQNLFPTILILLLVKPLPKSQQSSLCN